MSETIRIRLAEILGTEPECPAIPIAEIDAILAGQLPEDRLAEIERHAAQCPSCSGLLAEIAAFADAETRGAAANRASFRVADAQARAALGIDDRSRWPAWRAVLGAVAAALVVAAGLTLLVPDRRFPIDTATAPLVGPPLTRSASPSEAIDRARTALAAGDAELALSVIDDALDSFPGDAFLLHNQGVLRLRQGDSRGAITSLLASRRSQDLPSEETLFWLAVSEAESGDRAGACRTMQLVADMDEARSPEARRIVRVECAD